MVSLKILITVTALLASFVSGAVLYEEDDPDLILAGQIETQFGLVSWFTDNTSSTNTTTDEKDPEVRRGPKLHKRCGSNTVICSGKHGADVPVCETLVRGVFPLQSEMIPEDNNHRSVCLEQVGKRCCINWSKTPQGAFYQDLIDAAEKQLYTCQFRGQVSAKSKDVLLGYVCVNQCMASWNHCSGPETDSSYEKGRYLGTGSEYADHPVVEILPLNRPPR
ncbi:hypothetical protein QBC32DRAFT_221599 [Pseudoneurospora amorphoporcata]|uniref:WD-like domain-containing protein n=1 Tax=Pseudoneurospora amorphoporcata TaxID=241081 RepID=A0AAN6NMI6_9PEZI|nr:hypothetical protein QBC32DRAFT_221599 [Pseudoneurospora amorphoporcata]